MKRTLSSKNISSCPKTIKFDLETETKTNRSDKETEINGNQSENDCNPVSFGNDMPLALSNPALLSDEEPAISLRESIKDFKPITSEEALAGNCSRPVRVYADGVFDVFHAGHARLLRQAKSVFPNTYLIVGISPDHEVHSYKGQTVNIEWERYEAVLHCRYVDEVLRGCPWTLTLDFLDQMKIDFVAHDDLPYTSGGGGQADIYKEVKEAGRFVATQRTEGISTSDLISRVVKDYDHYVRRNLSRGYSRKDLNVGYFKEQEIKMKARFQKANDQRRAFVDSVESRSQEMLRRWEDNAKDMVGSFLDGFHSVQAARNIWNRSRGVFISRMIKSPEASSDEEADEEGFRTATDENQQSSSTNRTRRVAKRVNTNDIKYC